MGQLAARTNNMSGLKVSNLLGAACNKSLDSKANAEESLTGIAIIGLKMHRQTKLIVHYVSMKNNKTLDFPKLAFTPRPA